jgi:hypothetical protein
MKMPWMFPVEVEKWKEIFRQAACFVVHTGYSDINWCNVLLMDNGLGFVDFEWCKLDKLSIGQSLDQGLHLCFEPKSYNGQDQPKSGICKNWDK